MGKLGDAWKYLLPEAPVSVVFWNGKPITITPPNHVELRVEYCEPAARGNTATNVQKPARLETGIEVFYTEDIDDNDSYYAKVAPQLRAGQSIDRDIFTFTDWPILSTSVG